MIELINVSKYYPTEFGRHYVFRDVSLKLPLDKSVGVIGPNGAGKSTFLRLLGGADIPSEGKILRTGRISPPMGLTPGLQGSLNAAENARFAGRIYGMERDEIADLIEYVRETANIGKFFDMPVGTYSAGMKQRVAFAINMSMTFDYYLFDEIGAGGDREFRKTGKAMVQERLKTSKFIIASHRTDELLDLCESGIVIKDGTLTFFDDIKDALAAYNTEDDDDDEDREAKRAGRRARKAEASGGEVVTAEVKSERKAKRKARKSGKSDAPTDAQTAVQAESPSAAPEINAPEAEAAAATLRDSKRSARRARKSAAATPPPDEPAIQDIATAAVTPETTARAAEAAPPEDREARRAERRARKDKASAQTVTAAGTATSTEKPAAAAPEAAPAEEAEAEDRRADIKARRLRLRESRLKTRAAEAGQPLNGGAEIEMSASAQPPPRKPRLRGDEAWQAPPDTGSDRRNDGAKPRGGT